VEYPEYFFIASCLIMGIFFYVNWSKKRVIRKSGIREIDIMDGIDFEKKLEVMFGDLGYKVKRTPPSGDYGARIYNHGEGGGIYIFTENQANGRVIHKVIEVNNKRL